MHSIMTLALGLRRKQGLTKVRTESEAWKSHFNVVGNVGGCEGMNPHSQMGSHFGSWSLNGLPNFQKTIIGVKTHFFGKFLTPLKSSWNINVKMGSHITFEYLKHKLWSKKGRESKCQFDSWPLKIKNRPNLLMCKWCATYRWKALNESSNFTLDLTSIGGLDKKLWTSKVARVPTWSPKTKWHLNVTPWLIKKNTIKEKVVASPKSEPWWVLWIRVCSWLARAPKVLQLCINQLVVWFV